MTARGATLKAHSDRSVRFLRLRAELADSGV
jgi:hypothetical protein